MSNNRRSGRRAEVSIPAEVLVGGRRRSFAWVKDVSRTGARLRCTVRIPAEATIDLVLHPPGQPPVEVRAVIVQVEVGADARSFDLGVRFVDTPAPQLRTLALIVGAVRTGAAPMIDHAVVIMSRNSESRHQLAEVTAALGRRPVVLSNPLDAILWLQDDHTQVDAIIASERNPDLAEFLAFVAETHPAVRRVVSIERPRSRRSPQQGRPSHAHAVVTLPVRKEALREILASGERPAAPRAAPRG